MPTKPVKNPLVAPNPLTAIATWRVLVPLSILAAGVLVAWIASTSAAAHPDIAAWSTLVPSARGAVAHLRDPSQLQWYVVPLLVLVIYVYAVEVERRHWSAILAGLTLFAMDWLNELWNGLILYFSRYSAAWVTPGRSSLILLPGWNLEIAFMFAIAGVIFAKMLPRERRARLLGLPNRWVLAVGMAAFAVFVEVLLNRAGVLVWNLSWWNWPQVGLIFLVGYLPFFVAAFLVFDMRSRANQLAAVGILYAVDLAATLVFVVALGWM